MTAVRDSISNYVVRDPAATLVAMMEVMQAVSLMGYLLTAKDPKPPKVDTEEKTCDKPQPP